ncbi:hypothetical protein MTO96_045593 [Rhipicephalus appendiculatus]
MADQATDAVRDLLAKAEQSGEEDGDAVQRFEDLVAQGRDMLEQINDTLNSLLACRDEQRCRRRWRRSERLLLTTKGSSAASGGSNVSSRGAPQAHSKHGHCLLPGRPINTSGQIELCSFVRLRLLLR